MERLLAVAAAIDPRLLLAAALLVVDAWAIWLTFRAEASRRERWLWSGIILLCPIIGCVLWFLLGPKPDLVERPEAP